MTENAPLPFAAFAPPIRPQSELRQAITNAYRRPEAECVATRLVEAELPDNLREPVRDLAAQLVTALRAKHKGGGVEGLVREYALSSEEGIALMCLAEALLRIPDAATRDALIRDKIAPGDWKSHLGHGQSLFVNAATWGLVVTGKLTASGNVKDKSLSNALTRLIARAGEPVIRRAVKTGMEMMGEQFVTGQTIEEALKRVIPMEAKGFRYSYDMLGEAAVTQDDADRYYADYEQAFHAIGKASAGRGVYDGPGISIKLSALHPRYSRAQADRVIEELLPAVKKLMLIAKSYDIGVNIDAEEADRLELSLDLLESLAFDPDLAGWNGLGFVVQAYGKRCPYVIEYIIDLARRAGRRMMVRLVKGAYWDAEIKRAQIDGLSDFPVYTRKPYTDISYVACAKRLLSAPDAIFPQFATHNAQTLSTIYHLAGPDYDIGKYEFQCLHGMGEPLYDEVVDPKKLNRPCRVYAPVGTHETLLGYLVRRLLENGANSSFVNRISDPNVPVEALTIDPVELVKAMPHPGAPHDKIPLPLNLYADRANSAGIDLSDENALSQLTTALRGSAKRTWIAAPEGNSAEPSPVINPADHRDIVGQVIWANAQDITRATASAKASAWGHMSVEDRADCLNRAADKLQQDMPVLLGLIVREAGKSLPNAIAEVREAIDFLRYYAAEAKRILGGSQPLGPIACISPWNFPLAIFIGQVAAALAAGNPVLAKPAEETPLIAAQAVRILHEAGIPADALHLLPGDGSIGASLVVSKEVMGVIFTGSTEAAKHIQQQLGQRQSTTGHPIPLIAETGGQNAMIVDSSALTEQVVADVIASAFDSAGQRCSALRILCLQDDVADRTLEMLKGAIAQLRLGNTDLIANDIGPVITARAKLGIEGHVATMRANGRKVYRPPLPAKTEHGTFVAPTIIEIESITELKREIFGPVLHVIRFRSDEMESLIDAINATGYGLTFGLHTRMDSVVEKVTQRVRAGNLYVNRNVIGAVVGVQPFGGRGLSGTGPKAGGPLYLGRLISAPPQTEAVPCGRKPDAALADYINWLESKGEAAAVRHARACQQTSPLGVEVELSGPVGERNIYAVHPRGMIMLIPSTYNGLLDQISAVLATGNQGVIAGRNIPGGLPESVMRRLQIAEGGIKSGIRYSGVLIEANGEDARSILSTLASRTGPIPIAQSAMPREAEGSYRLDWMVEEVSLSINTAAAGGNASLMTIG